MKRTIPVLLSAAFFLLLILSLNGCGSPVSAGNGALSVVTTVFPPYDFAREIGGEHITVTQLLRPGAESHTFDPTPADILLVQNCDLFLYVGGESDAWVDTLLAAAENENRTVLRLIDMTDCMEEETVEGMTVHEHEHEHGHEDAHGHGDEHAHEDSDEVEYDEHVWTSPKNAVDLCECICAALCTLDEEYSADYRNACAAYTEKLAALDTRFTEIAENAPLHTLVFGDRFPFRYLCEDYGLSYRAAFPGCAAESEPSAATVAYLIKKIRAEGLPAVLSIELSNRKIAEAISGETGAPILTLHSCHNRTADEVERNETYLSLMEQNACVLEQALNP